MEGTPMRRFAAVLLLSLAATYAAHAQDWPTKPVRFIVPFPPGGSVDPLARLLGAKLGDALKQQFIVENRPGAGGNIATEMVVRSAPDGYTFIVVGANNAINASLYNNLNFNMLRDIVPVAGIYRVPQVMEVNPAFPARTVPEFIAYTKANPGKTNFASAGSGSVAHVTGEYFKMMTGIDMQHIPYRGAPPALTDLIGGQVHVMFDNLPSSIEHIRSGRLRPLGVCSLKRLDALPDVPPVADVVPGFETSAFAGLGAPQGTPAEIIDMINKGVNAGLADPKVATRIIELGGTPMPLSPEGFGKHVAEETEKWTKVVKFSGAKPG
jgi:tripartite-type tricarboxylate transporter receptor subunit TctC